MNLLDPTLLRSFLAVADTLQFTAAARRLGLSQSTVSQHVSRLERTVGRALLLRSTRSVELTADGTVMVGLAHDIVAVHDRALACFDPLVLRGVLRFGVSEDLVLSRLPEILRAFRTAHPLVDLELTVGLSGRLHEKMEAGVLDLVFAKRKSVDTIGVTIWQEQLSWLGSPDMRLEPEQPVPLVLLPGTSITRKAAIDALNRHGRAWYLACSSDNLSALLAAVRAGFGISAQLPVLAGVDLVTLPASAALPPLPVIDIVVLGRGRRLEGAVAALAEVITSNAELLRRPGSGTR